MGLRTVYGNTRSENGWPMVDQGSCTWTRIPGAPVSLQIQENQPLAILRAFAADYHAYVEPLRDADSACWTPTNSVATSNHLGGTGMDLNWNSHPFKVKGTFTPAQLATIRELQKFYTQDGLLMVFWAGDWRSPIDEMHWQMGYGTYGDRRTADFVAQKIRADGYSTFRRNPNENPTSPNLGDDRTAILAEAMGGAVPADRYAQLLPALTQSLQDCGATTVDRIAMWCAQIGHESVGLRHMEEIASGAAYEGRRDLGNTQPGDGVRFKGRGPIQITGRSNYRQLSQWAFVVGLVPTATFFVDNPAELASDRYGFVGVTWYWTVARPMNSYADRGDILGATKAVNGGTNGLDDRTKRWNRCRAMGDRLLALTSDPADPLEEFLMSDIQLESISIYATPGETRRFTPTEMLQSVDGMAHRRLVEDAARLGDPDSLQRIARTAAGQGKYRDAATIAHATRVLAEIEAATPELLTKYLNGKAS